MGFEIDFDIPEDIGGTSQYLKVEGKFHATVVSVNEGRKASSKSDDPNDFNGLLPGGFSANFEVIAGEHKNKKFSVNFKGEDLSKDKDSNPNKIARSRKSAFATACDLLDLKKMMMDFLQWKANGGQGELPKTNIELQDAIGSQVVVEMAFREFDGNNGEKVKYLDLKYDRIYHVDDPRSKDTERDEKLISSIPKENRHDLEYFKIPKIEKQSSSPPASQSTTRVSDADLDDI